MRKFWIVLAVASMVGSWGHLSRGQEVQFPGAPPMSGQHHRRDDPLNDRMREMAKERNEQRQKRLVEDTEKLLALATDLKTQVSQSSSEGMSADQLKQLDEIEKLAHKVKAGMRG